MEKKEKAAAGPFLALLFISLIWGLNWVVMKQSIQYVGPHVFNAIRMGMGSLLLFAFMAWRKKSLYPPIPRWTFLMGICQTAVGNTLIITALQCGGAGKTSILFYTMPFWILILAWFFLDERIRGTLWLPIIMAFCGLVLILEPWALGGTLLSKCLAVLAGICWASGTIMLKFFGQNRKIDVLSLTAWQLFFGAIPLVMLAIAIPSPPVEWTPFFIWSILYNIILVCGICLILWSYVIDRLPAGITGLGTMAIPIIGMTASRLHVGERIDLWEGWGIAVILMGLTVLSFIQLRENRQAAPVREDD